MSEAMRDSDSGWLSTCDACGRLAVTKAEDLLCADCKPRPTPILRAEGLGKFEGEPTVTRFLYTLSLEGCDDEVYDGERWWGLLNGPVTESDMPADADLTPDEREFLSTLGGVILYEDGNGFVSADYFEEFDSDKRESQWAKIQSEHGAEEEEES